MSITFFITETNCKLYLSIAQTMRGFVAWRPITTQDRQTSVSTQGNVQRNVAKWTNPMLVTKKLMSKTRHCYFSFVFHYTLTKSPATNQISDYINYCSTTISDYQSRQRIA